MTDAELVDDYRRQADERYVFGNVDVRKLIDVIDRKDAKIAELEERLKASGDCRPVGDFR